jgi:Tol biopolymer transport system component
MKARNPSAILAAIVAIIAFARCGSASGADDARRDAGGSATHVTGGTAYDARTPLPRPALFAPGVISTGDDDAHATFTASGDSVFFIKSTPTFGHWTVLVSRFVNGSWQTPEVASFSGRYNDADVSFAPDGQSIFFVSNRPLRPGEPAREDTDIWMMRRAASGWSEPVHLAALASDGNEWFPTVTRNGTIYFGSERRAGNRGPAGTSDLWRSRLVDGRYTKPENLGSVINTAGQDIEAYVSPDESSMILSSKGRADSRGAYDLYVSYQRDDRWTEPRNLGDSINSDGWEFGARISPDGKYLFFTSNRGVLDKPLPRRLDYRELSDALRRPGNGLRDIYQVDVSALGLERR